MKKNEECKIVRDLLPSCVDKVTDEVTNKFIQDHIQECEECKKVLENMGEEVILDKVKEKEKLDYLKKVRRRQGIKIALVTIILLIMIVSSIVFCMFMATAKPYKDESGNVDYMKSFLYWIGVNKNFYIDEEVKNWTGERVNISHSILKRVDSNEIIHIQIFTFDNNRNICVGMKYILNGLEENELDKLYREYKELDEQQAEEPKMTDITNVKIQDGKLTFSMNNYTNVSTQRVKDVIETIKKSGWALIEI